MPILLNSCGDDDDILSSQEEELIGEWAIIKTPDAQSDDYHYVFKKEHTGSRWHLEDGTVVSDISFKWTLSGNRLTLDYGTGNQLVLEISMGINKMHVVYVATGAYEDYQRVVSSDD